MATKSEIANSASQPDLVSNLYWYGWMDFIVIWACLMIGLFLRPHDYSGRSIEFVVMGSTIIQPEGQDVNLEVADGFPYRIYRDGKSLPVEERDSPLDYGYPHYYYFYTEKAEDKEFVLRSGNADLSVRLTSPDIITVRVIPTFWRGVITSVVIIILGGIVWFLGILCVVLVLMF